MRFLLGTYFLFIFLISPVSILAAEAKNKTEANSTTGNNLHDDKEEDTYVYFLLGKRDPFNSLILNRKSKDKRLSLQRRKEAEKLLANVPFTPLQKFDLASLKLKAIIVGEIGNFAMIRAPDGKAYTITKGTYIGKNRGVVKKILQDRIMISEKYIDFDNSIKTRSVELNLRLEK